MSETERSPKEVLTEIQEGLVAPTAAERLAALSTLKTLSFSSVAVLRRLEKMALNDRSQAVKKAALDVLQMPLHRQVQAHQSKLAEFSRRMVLTEIEVWREDGLLEERQADVLRERYAFDMQPAPEAPAKTTPAVAVAKKVRVSSVRKPRPKSTSAKSKPVAPPKPRKPKRTLAQTLFSEASIKVALYLGAFFVIAAAAILAAAVKELRLPILLFFTFAFGTGSVVLKKRLPPASFTLFIIFSMLLPINFSVIADQFNIVGQGAHLYWFFVSLLMSVIWVFATWFFHSRFFSVVAFLALDVSIYNLINSFKGDPRLDLYLLLWAFVALIGLGAFELIKRWQDEKFSMPLFWLSQAQMLLLLLTSFITIFAHLSFFDVERGWWLATTGIWGLAAVFYWFSNGGKKNLLFRIMAVVSMMPLSWLFLKAFAASATVQASIMLLWAALFAFSGEVFHAREDGKFHDYGRWLIIGAALLAGASILLGIIENDTLGFWLALGALVLFTVMSIYRIRMWTWSYALLAGLLAYALFFTFDFMREVELFYGFKDLIPSLLLLLPDLFLKNDFKADLLWRLPPRLMGVALVLINTLAILDAPDQHLWEVALIFGFYALWGLGYALRYFPEYAYITNTAVALSVIYTLFSVDAQHWIVPLAALAVLYYLIGFGLARIERSRWARVYILSGLLLGGLVAISAPYEDLGIVKSVPVLIVAALFTVETFRAKTLWLALPANGFLLMAFGMILFDVEEDLSKFYWLIASAGMLTHYIIGWLLGYTKQAEKADVFRYGGLVAAALASLSVLYVEPELVRIIPLLITVALFTVEAFRKRNLGFAIVANGFYVLTYFVVLDNFDASAAWLYYLIAITGMLIHYLVGWGLERTEQPDFADVYRYGGLLTALLASLTVLQREIDLLRIIPVLIATVLFTLETFRKKKIGFSFPANALYILAYFMTLSYFDLHGATWLYYLAATLGMLIHYFGGLALERTKEITLADIYRYGGLLTAVLAAGLAPFRDVGMVKVVPVVFAAMLFTVEAFHKRNLWLGFPANALYLMAYFMSLNNFEIDQPQFYSVAAAALGMLMHYLLVRAGSKKAAFITGMLSQLVLLTTTYFQLVSEESLGYFAVLFFQALAVLIYGIVIRSRSLLITPIIFLVLGVLTVTFNLVSSEWSIFLIGCTGVLLIVFAIGALLLREKFASLREQLGDWNA